MIYRVEGFWEVYEVQFCVYFVRCFVVLKVFQKTQNMHASFLSLDKADLASMDLIHHIL